MISIIIPTYNSEKYLNQCLQSIFSQTYKDFEVIVIDAYSIDSTYNILSKYNIKPILREPRGEPDAINYGMKLAKGDIVAYIDADDTYNRDCFIIVNKLFNNNPKVQWLYSSGKIIDSNGKECRSIITRIKKFFWKHYSFNSYLLSNYIVQPTVFMRKSFYDRVGIFNTSLKYVFDYDYYIRTGKLSKPMFINYPLANWRAHTESVTAQAPAETAKQALQVQRRYSNWLFRPLQLVLYMLNITIYSILKK